ncbi:PolC-type DNA polymerase III, partial [Tyzzerella sp. OttesenSCG-928-J15]|nr:PolC-type DNA polymerase III [Tyzzerella sp. OttesenSCG-928-J15]
LIKDGICTLEEVIPTRDDIMVYLIAKGMERLTSFKIMEDVRKGKGLKPEYEELMKDAGIPDWYIESCKRIKYMFPKGHAVAYVMMTVRIGYFKLYHPYSFYGASFSVKYDDFDYEIMCKGKEVVKEEIRRIKTLGNDASAKEKNTLSMLELVNEMYCRGLKFVPLDMYKANSTKFIVTEEGLMPPLCSIQGLGETVANNIISARKDGEFFTVDDFRQRTKATKTVIELLKKNDVLSGIPETNQLTLF